MTGAPPDGGLTHRTIQADDGETIHYYTAGRADVAAPLLVFLHGLGSNHTRWQRLVRQPFFRDECRVRVVDLRGHGASHARRGMTPDQIARDVATLLAHEGAERAVLIGHCLGANLAVRAWELCPGQAGGLVFIEPFVALAMRLDLKLLHRLSLPLLWCCDGAARLLNAAGIRRRQFRTVDYEVYDDWVRPRLTSFWNVVRYMGPWVDLQTMPVTSYLQAFEMLFSYRPPWEMIACPTLAIYGKEAELADEAGRRPLLANPNVRVRDLKASHFVLTDNMSGVAESIESFVRELAGGN